MYRNRCLLALSALMFWNSASYDARAEQDAATTTDPSVAADAKRDQRFANYMTGVKFVGRFTIIGSQTDELPEEEYTISKCEKVEGTDRFRFTARIRYGNTDTELPMELPVQWAGNTPVISLQDFWLPPLGTFSCRVVIHQDRYAGTWDHGKKGGHLFGKIVPADAEQSGQRSATEDP